VQRIASPQDQRFEPFGPRIEPRVVWLRSPLGGWAAKANLTFQPPRILPVYFHGVPKDSNLACRGDERSGSEKINPRKPIMGDRSPKSVQKKATQKQTQANDASSKKQQLITSQQATKAKAALSKKK
jgi:hypothetical protein